MTNFEEALSALRVIAGADQVITQEPVLEQYATATFALTNRVRAVVRPQEAEQVQRIVRVANRFGLKLYPISRGRNWGLGSRAPVGDDSVVIDMSRMNRITDFSEELAYVTVEPGVTFRQLSDFLTSRGSQLYASAIGGPPDASLIGNALERGDGLGPLGERSEQCCGLEAVSGSGAPIQTGPQVFGCEDVGKLWAQVAGPNLQGLLLQSNFAIVTRMTIWLARRPQAFQGICMAIPSAASLVQVTSALRALQQDGVLLPNSCALWNAYKLLASLMQYPWPADGQPYSSSQALLAHLPRGLAGAPWIGMAALYSASEAHARADKKLLRKALGKHVSRLMILNRRSAAMLHGLRPLIMKLSGMDPELFVRLLYEQSPFLGHPTEFSAASTYWRKRSPRPAQMDPDRDRCGLHWVCTGLPFDGEHVRKHAGIVEQVAAEQRLEPNVSYLNASPRMLKSFAVISFDRDAGDEETRARTCHDEMLRRLVDAGYPPIRLGVQSMSTVAPSSSAHISIVRDLKRLFDPNGVLAPGHYDFADGGAAASGFFARGTSRTQQAS